MDAVVLDLFGTLVTAPTPRERAHAATRLATAGGCEPTAIERYFRDSWRARHDGTLPTVADLAAHVVHALDGSDAMIGRVSTELRALGQARLVPDASVVEAIRSLRSRGMRLSILSDASAEVAAAWPKSPLSPLIDTAVFSCHAGSVKPDQRLYDRVRVELDVPAHRMLYVGDGGGDELRGALTAGMAAVAVRRRGPSDALAFGHADWPGRLLNAVEQVPAYLAELS